MTIQVNMLSIIHNYNFCALIVAKIRSPAEWLATLNLSVVTRVGCCSVGIVSDHKDIVTSVVDAGLDDGSFEIFGNWGKAVFSEVARIMLLSDKFLRSLLNLKASCFRFLVDRIWREGRVTHSHHKVLHIILTNFLSCKRNWVRQKL